MKRVGVTLKERTREQSDYQSREEGSVWSLTLQVYEACRVDLGRENMWRKRWL